MGSTGPAVLFRDDLAGQELAFERPSTVISAEDAGSFEPALQAAQAAHRAGGWLAGYLSYEAGFLLEPKLAPLLPAGRRTPLICLGVFDDPPDRSRPTRRSLNSGTPIVGGAPAWSYQDYQRRFTRLHRHIRDGDCYQANLTFPIRARWSGDPLAAFDALTERQPVRYGALVMLGDPIVLSRSPELFFDIDVDRFVEAHPMKGTAPRGGTAAADRELRERLLHDPKSRAENLMIVDVLRNDISAISEVGSVGVPELFAIETYRTVHQMVSKVRARLLPGWTLRRILAALFPCGSVTGAPKIRAIEILRDLETVPRDVYCGAIGWIAPDGRARFSVAIRTICLHPGGEAVYHVGGGVVLDSTAAEEYQECLLKARFVTSGPPISS